MGKRERENRQGKHDEEGSKPERIGRLDEQTLGYYRRVSESLQGRFATEEEKELFLNNVFGEVSQEALVVSRNQSVSNTVETLLRHGNRSHIQLFMNAICLDWELACTDRFACHVTQTLLVKTSPYLTQEAAKTRSEEEKKDLQSIKELFVDLWMFLMDKLAVYMQHTYASHIVRVMLELTGGAAISQQVVRSKMSYKHAQGNDKSFGKELSVPSQDIIELFHQMCDRITELPMLADHVKNQLSNPVLQTMVLVLAKRDPAKCATVCEQFIAKTAMFVKPGGDEDSLSPMLGHEVASRLVEQILSILPTQLYDQVLQQLSGQLVSMAIHPVANFVLQSLIAQLHNETQFEDVFKSVSPRLEDILARNHMQVVVRLAEGAVKHGVMQEKYFKALMKAFHCYKPKERQMKCVPLIASLGTYESFYNQPEDDEASGDEKPEAKESKPKEESIPLLTTVNLHGSILLQNLFKFGNPKLTISSFLELTPVELVTMSCDPRGCHVMEAFLASEQVGLKNKKTLAGKFEDQYLKLACSKYGSRTFDSLWKALGIKSRHTIAEELANHSSKIQGDQFGRFIWRNCQMDHFVRNKDQWRELQTGAAKKERLFADILGDDKEGADKKKKKKRKAVEEAEGESGILLEGDSDGEKEVVDLGDLLTVKKPKSTTDDTDASATPGKKGGQNKGSEKRSHLKDNGTPSPKKSKKQHKT